MTKPQETHLKSSNCNFYAECGGCNLLHLTTDEYQNFKKENLNKLFQNSEIKLDQKIGWIEVGPNSRRKITLQINHKNQLGFLKNRSKEIIVIDKCFIAEKTINQSLPTIQNFLNSQKAKLFTQITITSFDNCLDLVFRVNKDLDFLQTQKLSKLAQENNFNISYKIDKHHSPILLKQPNQIHYPNFSINLDSDIFIQATKSGLEAIIKIIRDFLQTTIKEQPTTKIADIYSGFGAYSFAIIDLAKNIVGFEGDEKMVNLFNKNAKENNLNQIARSEVRDLYSDPIDKKELKDFDVVIINPPRNGASPQIKEIAKSKISAVIYVSCNPQSFLRDAKILIDLGYKITKLSALDQFYGNKHLELIAIFTK